MNIFKKTLSVVVLLVVSATACFADVRNPRGTMQLTLPAFLNIKPLTSTVLKANIMDDTGNLQKPMYAKFRVISNTRNTKLYLRGKVMTDKGYKSALFKNGSQVYLAFGNVEEKPSAKALLDCKNGGLPEVSPGVVAYPVTSVRGAKKTTYVFSKCRYELFVDNGTTDITINVGSKVLQSTFAPNDPKGQYQAILSLTEADI